MIWTGGALDNLHFSGLTRCGIQFNILPWRFSRRPRKLNQAILDAPNIGHRLEQQCFGKE